MLKDSQYLKRTMQSQLPTFNDNFSLSEEELTTSGPKINISARTSERKSELTTPVPPPKFFFRACVSVELEQMFYYKIKWFGLFGARV